MAKKKMNRKTVKTRAVSTQKSTRQQPRDQPSRRGTGQRLVANLGKEAEIYAVSMANPYQGPLPTIPSVPSVLTNRLRVYVKGSFSTNGTGTGAGFVGMTPFLALFADIPGGSSSFVVTTDSTYTGLALPFGAATGVIQHASNSPHISSQFIAGGLRGRVVTAGLRIRYAGSELNRGGYAVGLVEPNHDPLTAQTESQFEAYQEARRFPATRNWIGCVYRPVLDTDDDFNIATSSPAWAAPGSQYIAFAIVPASTGVPLTWEFEAYGNIEIIGQNMRNKTISPIDLQGHASVMSTATGHPHLNSASDMPSGTKADNFLNAVQQYHATTSGVHLLDLATKAVSHLPTALDVAGKTASLLEGGLDLLAAFV